MKNATYWAERAGRRTKQYDRIAERTVQRVTKAYKKALTDINGDIQRILGVYAKKGEMSLNDAKTLLNARETEAVLNGLRQKLDGIADPGLRREALSRINAPAYAHRISRLEALKDSIYANIKQLAGVEIDEDSSAFERIVKEVYNRHIFDAQQGTGFGFSFARMDDGRTAEILRNAWSGEHYSARIWSNTDALAEQVQDVLLSGLQQGKNYRRMADDLAERMGAGNYYASRIIRTEAAAMAGMADQAAYEECGTEKVRFLATLDTVTSEMCREMDGKVILVEELEVGKNSPPLHPHCRSTTVEVFDDMDLSDLQRRARDENGRPILVSADTTYEDWAERFIPQESDSKVKKAAQGFFSGGKTVKYSALPESTRTRFEAGLKAAEPSVRVLLEREIKSADFYVTDSKKSFYTRHVDYIQIHKDADPGTLAHELFHRIDAKNGISRGGELKKALDRDFRRLKTESGGDITAHLRREYPEMWRQKQSGGWAVKKEFRGISDILNGLSEGELNYGFKHPAEYWNRSKHTVSRESWAQFGRVGYDNDPQVQTTLKKLFPHFFDRATMTLKELL